MITVNLPRQVSMLIQPPRYSPLLLLDLTACGISLEPGLVLLWEQQKAS